jgi:DNA modification methylase
MPYKEARENQEEKHACPLQLDIIERCLLLWSNPGETMLTPFMGVGSECYGAVINNRRAIGIELKPTYYRQAVRNLIGADEAKREQSFALECDGHEDADGDEDEEEAGVFARMD